MINCERLLSTFLDYVKVDSESGNEKAMMELLTKQLSELGCDVVADKAGEKIGSNANNLYAFFKGTLPGDPIIFSAHMDTVTPGNGIVPVVSDGVITSQGDTILGGDDKSGIVGIVEALRTVVEKKLPCHDFQVLLSISEESGLQGAANFDYSLIKGKDAVVLDGGGDVGTVTVSAPGQNTLNAVILGKAAHAGMEPEKGVSSIQVAARAVAAMNLLRIDPETTCNIGTFKAVGANNIVSPRTELSAEIRSRDAQKLQAQTDHLCDCLRKACEEGGAELELDVTSTYTAYKFDVDNHLVQRIKRSCDALGLTFKTVPGGGGSDANRMNLKGMNAVVVSTGMSKPHTLQESISVKNLENTARLVLAMMTD